MFNHPYRTFTTSFKNEELQCNIEAKNIYANKQAVASKITCCIGLQTYDVCLAAKCKGSLSSNSGCKVTPAYKDCHPQMTIAQCKDLPSSNASLVYILIVLAIILLIVIIIVIWIVTNRKLNSKKMGKYSKNKAKLSFFKGLTVASSVDNKDKDKKHKKHKKKTKEDAPAGENEAPPGPSAD